MVENQALTRASGFARSRAEFVEDTELELSFLADITRFVGVLQTDPKFASRYKPLIDQLIDYLVSALLQLEVQEIRQALGILDRKEPENIDQLVGFLRGALHGYQGSGSDSTTPSPREHVASLFQLALSFSEHQDDTNEERIELTRMAMLIAFIKAADLNEDEYEALKGQVEMEVSWPSKDYLDSHKNEITRQYWGMTNQY